jgi:hypothetical protein
MARKTIKKPARKVSTRKATAKKTTAKKTRRNPLVAAKAAVVVAQKRVNAARKVLDRAATAFAKANIRVTELEAKAVAKAAK